MVVQAYRAQTEVVMKENPQERDIEIAEKALEKAVARLREARRDVSLAITALAGVRRTVRGVSRKSPRDRRKTSKSGEHGA